MFTFKGTADSRHSSDRLSSRNAQIINGGDREARADEEEQRDGSVSFHHLLKISNFFKIHKNLSKVLTKNFNFRQNLNLKLNLSLSFEEKQNIFNIKILL